MVRDRATEILNLKQYSRYNEAEFVRRVYVECPYDRQYILRMLVRDTFSPITLPPELEWITPLVYLANEYQNKLIKVRHSFCYVTVRHGLVESETDDEWHVDGFSTSITHIPEQNYIWTDKYPTEYMLEKFDFPDDFDPQKHNINKFLATYHKHPFIARLNSHCMYVLDPYVVHRRPNIPTDVERTFVRISFVPIEINDINNTQNPLLPRVYTRDGIKAFRDGLIDYHKEI